MNTLQGDIIDVKTAEGISLVKVKAGEVIFSSMIIIEPSNSKYLSIGKPVTLNFKETELIIAKPGIMEISVQNKVECIIKNIEMGEILSQVTLDFNGIKLVSIITSNAVKQLRLGPGEKVIGLIKTNEVSLSYHD